MRCKSDGLIYCFDISWRYWYG